MVRGRAARARGSSRDLRRRRALRPGFAAGRALRLRAADGHLQVDEPRRELHLRRQLSTVLSRGNTTQAALGHARETTVSLPVNHAVSQALLFSGIPPRTARLTITALQIRSSGTRRVWRGPILGVWTDDVLARLRFPMPWIRRSPSRSRSRWRPRVAITRSTMRVAPSRARRSRSSVQLLTSHSRQGRHHL